MSSCLVIFPDAVVGMRVDDLQALGELVRGQTLFLQPIHGGLQVEAGTAVDARTRTSAHPAGRRAGRPRQPVRPRGRGQQLLDLARRDVEPPRMMISFFRPTTVRYPSSSIVARSPDRTQPSTKVAAVRSGSSKNPTQVLGPRTAISPGCAGARRVAPVVSDLDLDVRSWPCRRCLGVPRLECRAGSTWPPAPRSSRTGAARAMPALPAASTRSGGTGAPPQPKQRRVPSDRAARGRLDQVLEEGGGGQGVACTVRATIRSTASPPSQRSCSTSDSPW